QLFVVRVRGTPSVPRFGLEPLPLAIDFFKTIGGRNAAQRPDRLP
ncbi:MAG: hypothetical protein QOE66_3222, partial [Chloroflexota bacterium]|nr:hypothetical protein [Chloroflexota bacterium]